jgi:hypothetical protein
MRAARKFRNATFMNMQDRNVAFLNLRGRDPAQHQRQSQRRS